MTEYKLLSLLCAAEGEFVSGQRISEVLGVSRTAVWKQIDRLREQGCEIESVTHRGYRLVQLPDLLTRPLLEQYLPQGRAASIFCHEELDSTNTAALKLAVEGAPSGTVVIADRQTRGSGRLGRRFESPGGVGIYLSYLLRPDCDTAALSLLTSYAGLCVCEELEQYGLTPAIKWPNDIIIDRRKVCGILTKLTADAETATINGAVIGIGVNVCQAREDFPPELQDKAISVKEAGTTVPRAKLAAGIIRRLDECFLQKNLLRQPPEASIAALKARSCTVGSRVVVITPTDEYEAEAVDIAPDAGLVVRLEDGSTRTVSSGEVSVRGLLGYT